MEEDVGPGSELVVENMGGEESYEKGDGGEIMVEVVGSDVFVNGVGGDLEGHEWEKREENGSRDIADAMDVWNEGDGSKMVEGEVGFLELRVVKCGAVDKDSANFVTSELLNHPVEDIADLDQLGEEIGSRLDPNAEGLDNVQVGGGVGEVGLVIVIEGGEVPSNDSPKDGDSKAEAELASTDTDDVDLDTKPQGINTKIDQKVEVSQRKDVDGDKYREKDEGIDSEMLEHDASTEIVHLSESSSPSKVDMADIKVADNHFVCNDLVGVFELAQNKEQEATLGISEATDIPVRLTEETDHGVDKLAGTDLLPNEVTSIPEITEKAELHGGDMEETLGFDAAITSDEVNKTMKAEDNSSNADGSYIVEDYTCETELMDVEEESESERNNVPELGNEELAFETDKLNSSNEETIKSASLFEMYTPQSKGQFAQSDLVWGKPRSHSWWPGQIFDLADASEKAMKHHRNDSYLVAYFGDRTFDWNDASILKPFMPHFSEIVKQTNSEAFQHAINSALEEVSRRVELGLACSCIPKDAYIKIGTQVIENTGIREESSRRCGVCSRATSFEPAKLLEYISNLAPHASSCTDRLDLVIARAQLAAFFRFKGYRPPTEFPSFREMLENDVDTEQVTHETVAFHKHRHNPMEGSYSRKERSLTELMGDTKHTPIVKYEPVSFHAAKISTSMSHAPKPALRIGACISRVACHLTGSTVDGPPKTYERSENQNVAMSAETFSVSEMLSQLQFTAQDPKKRQNIQDSMHTFFRDFRSSVVPNRRGGKRKAEPTIGKEFEFDDANDSYWNDRIVQNYSGEQLRHEWENRASNIQPFGEKPIKTGLKRRKRFSVGNYPMAVTESDDTIMRQKLKSSPAELILDFADKNCVPSEINLNKMFRRFGSLMESETEVDHDSGRAKVIFKRGSDAEVAHSSAQKFNIFAPILVNYEIGYTPLISVKVLPLAMPQCPEDDSLML